MISTMEKNTTERGKAVLEKRKMEISDQVASH